MEILVLSLLGRKQLERMEQQTTEQKLASENIVSENPNTIQQVPLQMEPSQMYTPETSALKKGSIGATISFLSSSAINLVIWITAMVLCFKRYKGQSNGKRIGMFILAFFFPVIYLIFHGVTSK
jgi:hypothetical protein